MKCEALNYRMLYRSLAAKQIIGQVDRGSSAGHLCGVCGLWRGFTGKFHCYLVTQTLQFLAMFDAMLQNIFLIKHVGP